MTIEKKIAEMKELKKAFKEWVRKKDYRLSSAPEDGGLKAYEIQSIVETWIDRPDRYASAKNLASAILGAAHLEDTLHHVAGAEPDLPYEKLNRLQFEMLIEAAAISIAEKMSHLNGETCSKKSVLDFYSYHLDDGFGIPRKEGKKLLKQGIDVYLKIYKITAAK